MYLIFFKYGTLQASGQYVFVLPKIGQNSHIRTYVNLSDTQTIIKYIYIHVYTLLIFRS